MKLGLWNIDHPEAGTRSRTKQRRFDRVCDHLTAANCDVLILTESNTAMDLEGYTSLFSAESPFKASRRDYNSPNKYHQVAVYSKLPVSQHKVQEDINSILVTAGEGDDALLIYGNVVTIKDQWSKGSDLKYSDRLDQQIGSIQSLPQKRAIVAGDFNLRLGWPQKRFAHKRVKEELTGREWIWPTELREDTVQHVLHTPDVCLDLDVDFSVKRGDGNTNGLSDHPFVTMSVNAL